jgi:TolC family type I secretion outer membrane protein
MRRWFGMLALVALAPSYAEAETLADAIAAAYANNPTLQAARAQTRATDETFVQARSGYLPRVDLSGAYGVRRVDQTSPGAKTNLSDLEPNQYGLTATQDLFTGGRRSGEMKRADATIDAAQQQLRSTEQIILLQAIAAYVDVRRDEDVVTIRINNVEVLSRQLEEAKARFEVGDLTRTDVAQAEARLAGAQSDLSAARSTLAASRARYAEIIGNAPGTLEPPPPPPDLPDSLQAAVDAAIAANPDYLALKEQERAAKAQIQIDRSDLLPQISITGAINRGFEQSVPDIETETATASAQVTVPLYEGGLFRSRVRQSKENFTRAQALAEAARRQVVSQVTSAWNDLDAARQVIASSQQQEKANELALQGAREEFGVGLRTTLDVLNAEQELLDSRLAVVGAQRDAYVAAYALLQSVGGLDGKALSVNAPLYDPDKHRGQAKWRF